MRNVKTLRNRKDKLCGNNKNKIKTKETKMIKKLLLGLALTTGLMMANTVKDDLLSLATMGKTAGTALEMNKSDMEKADGGYYSYRGVGSYYYNLNTRASYSTRNSYSSRIYARAFGSYYWGRSYGRY